MPTITSHQYTQGGVHIVWVIAEGAVDLTHWNKRIRVSKNIWPCEDVVLGPIPES